MNVWQCNICFRTLRNSFDGNNYPVILIPCNHGGLCNECCNKLDKKICPFCRKDFVQIIPNIDLAKEYCIDVHYPEINTSNQQNNNNDSVAIDVVLDVPSSSSDDSYCVQHLVQHLFVALILSICIFVPWFIYEKSK